MTTANYGDLTLNKVLVVILLLATLMTVFISYYLEQEKEIETTALKAVAANFISQVTVVRSQWLMDKKPKQVNIEIRDKNTVMKKVMTVNQQGWIDSNHATNACEAIWLMVMDRPLAFFNMPIGAINIKNQRNNVAHDNGRKCRYTVKNGDYFEYNSANGQVSKVHNKNNL